ncbi:MAG: 50S ribosomal protein L1 [Pseudomonadota bacterium]
MKFRGKNYKLSAEKMSSQDLYTFEEGVKKVTELSTVKFDETVDLAIKLGVNPKHADQMVRSSVVLPNGLGKEVRVLAFAKGDKEIEAKEAGADYVGAEDLVEKIQGGWLEFEKVCATPDMMAKVGKIGRILGTKGLMPNPKVGTVTMDIGRVVKELKAGKVEFRVEKAGILHAPIGKVSFGPEKLMENAKALLETVLKLKPQTSKGTYMKAITISSTMGVGIKLDTLDVRNYFKK